MAPVHVSKGPGDAPLHSPMGPQCVPTGVSRTLTHVTLTWTGYPCRPPHLMGASGVSPAGVPGNPDPVSKLLGVPIVVDNLNRLHTQLSDLVIKLESVTHLSKS